MGKSKKSVEQILAKLDRPPAAHNFARCNFQKKDRTRDALVNLALGFPTISYRWALSVIELSVADNLDDATALKTLQKNCPGSQYDPNAELLNAFLNYRKIRNFDGIRVFPEFKSAFQAGVDVSVGVSPTFIIRENGKLKPVFVMGWASNGLDYFQRRLLSTIYEDAIYSLTDFRSSEGEVLFFPKNGYGVRVADRWLRGTYEHLSRDELTEQVRRFVTARSEALPIIKDRYEERARKSEDRHRDSRPEAGGGPSPKP